MKGQRKVGAGVFIKFLISSLSSSFLDLMLFSVFCYLLCSVQWNVDWYIVLATIMARICSATYNFLMNYKVVFRSQENIKRAMVRYVVLATVQMFLSAMLVSMIFPLFGGYEVWVKIPVDIFLFLVNYVIQKKVIY